MRNPSKGYEPHERDALIAQAKQHARRMRRQAVPDFWNGVNVSCAKAAGGLSRFLMRVTRHRQSRLLMSANHSKVKKGALTCPF